MVKCQAKVALVLLSVVGLVAGAQSPANSPVGQDTQVRGYWIDPSTGLMWAGKDNGKDVTWHGAVKYCRNLRLAGYSDWKLANMGELLAIYDKSAEAPGLAGPPKKPRAFTWHVKGDLFLTGDQWSSTRRYDDRGHPARYAWYVDLNQGKQIDDQGGYSTNKRALCMRRPKEK